MQKRSYWGLGIACIMFLLSCEGGAVRSVRLSSDSLVVDERINTRKDRILDMNGEILEGLRIVMKFFSPLVYRNRVKDSTYIEFIGGVTGQFYNAKTKKKSGDVEAKYGIFYRKQKKMYLEDKVRLTNNKGDLLKAENLWWDQEAKRIYTDDRITFLQDGSRIDGKGFTANEDMTEYEVRKITGRIKDGTL